MTATANIMSRYFELTKPKVVALIDQGRIVAEGTHETLLREQGLYQRLARLQFDLEAIS